MKSASNKGNGISLIVLVITIIIMIILAGAIILSLNSSEVIDKANNATEDTNIANVKEIVSMAQAEWLLMNESARTANGGNFVSYAEDKL